MAGPETCLPGPGIKYSALVLHRTSTYLRMGHLIDDSEVE